MIVRNTRDCTGCRSCELACSFHHQGVFSPVLSGIRVRRPSGGGKIELLLYLEPGENHAKCDCKPGEEFCLKFCPASAREELLSLLSEREMVR